MVLIRNGGRLHTTNWWPKMASSSLASSQDDPSCLLQVTVDSTTPDGLKLSDFTCKQAKRVLTLRTPRQLLYTWKRNAAGRSHSYINA